MLEKEQQLQDNITIAKLDNKRLETMLAQATSRNMILLKQL